MAQISIKNVTVENKGTYKIAVVSYDTSGKFAKFDQTKKVMSFGPSATVFPELAALKNFPVSADVTNTKEGEFWNWTAIKVLGTGVAGTSAPAASVAGAAPATGTYARGGVSDDVRQRLIVRQSSLERALELAALNGNKKATALDIMRTAEDFHEYVFNGLSGIGAKAVDALAAPTSVSDDIDPDADIQY